MNREKMKFWATCPKCKQKFGINPETILKYVDRLLSEMQTKIDKKEPQRYKKGV